MGSFRCYDSSNVIATLMVTNFHLNTTDVAIFQMFVYGDVVYAQTWYWPWKTVSSHLHMPGRPMLLQYGPHFFLTLSLKFGQLAGFFWANGLPPPPGIKFPVRLCSSVTWVHILEVCCWFFPLPKMIFPWCSQPHIHGMLDHKMKIHLVDALTTSTV